MMFTHVQAMGPDEVVGESSSDIDAGLSEPTFEGSSSKLGKGRSLSLDKSLTLYIGSTRSTSDNILTSAISILKTNNFTNFICE